MVRAMASALDGGLVQYSCDAANFPHAPLLSGMGTWLLRDQAARGRRDEHCPHKDTGLKKTMVSYTSLPSDWKMLGDDLTFFSEGSRKILHMKLNSAFTLLNVNQLISICISQCSSVIGTVFIHEPTSDMSQRVELQITSPWSNMDESRG